MKLGVTLFAQNYNDWARFEAYEAGDENAPVSDGSDATVWEDEKRLGNQIEPLGYDSIWSVEHHFTPYTMVTNVIQFLSYWAGRTERVGMGTMVAVLPWHNPVRLAEEIVMLQHLLGDRELKIGFGRGAGRREFGGMTVPMGESRDRFLEALEIIRLALSEERFSYDGEFFTIPDVEQRPESPTISLRPRPRSPRILDEFYCAWGSPQTAPIAAKAGLKPLIIPQKAFADYTDEFDEFNRMRAESGFPPARPALVTWVFCDEDEKKAEEGARQYMGQYADSAMRHYEFMSSHFATTKGYDHYAMLKELLPEASAFGEIFLKDHIWGTPEQCIERLQAANDFMAPSEFVGVFKYGAMPVEVAEHSMQLFANEVLPFVHELKESEHQPA